MKLAAALSLLGICLAWPAHAGGVLVVRAKGSQIDEATAALKGELGGDITELAIDEGTSPDVVLEKIDGMSLVVGVGARAAQLAMKQDKVPVVHCMVLQDAAALDGDRSVGVPLTIPPRAQLEALKRVAPGVKKVGILYDPKLNERFVEDAKAAARALGMVIIARSVVTATAAPAALDALLPDINALIVIPDATVVTKELITFIVARAFDKKIPVVTYSEGLVKLGALAALAPSYAQNGKLCAQLAKRLLAGEKAADLHGAVQMSGTLVVNVATARRIGLALAPEVIRAPTRVVGE